MNDYLLWGAGAVLVLLIALLVRRRSAPVPRRGQSGNRQRPASETTRAADAVLSRSRGASQFDTANAVHEMELAPVAGVDVSVARESAREATEAAELAARADADREAAEWEARLVAQLLADQESERAASDAERVAAEAAANAPPPPDEQAIREQADREAAEWEAKLVAQRLADEEARRVEAERLAAEAAAAAQLQRDIAAHAALEQAAQERFDRAVDEQLARLEAQRAAEAAQAEATSARIAADALAAASTAAAASVMSAEPTSVVASGPRTPEQCLVMIADDSKVVRVKTSRLLAKHLYRVSLAEDGLDAARQIEIDLPDVLITDVEMPGMDGFELTRQVRSNPRTAHIPIVMITADDEKHRADAAEAGVSVLLSKPYPEDQLLSYLQSTLSCAAAH
jgi:CheY-like chemotaxis protein